MLRDGVDRADILAGYPRLDDHLLDLAPIWVAAHPARGRPRSLKDFGTVPRSSVSLPLGDEPERASMSEAGASM